MFNNYFKLFESKSGLNILVLELITHGYINLITYNQNNNLKVLASNLNEFDKDELSTHLKSTLAYADIEYIENNLTNDYKIRLERIVKEGYNDVTIKHENKNAKSFPRLYNSKHGNKNIADYLSSSGIKNYIFKEDDIKVDIPNNNDHYKFNLEQQYKLSNLNINDYKINMTDQDDYDVIVKSNAFERVMRSVNSNRSFSRKRNILLMGEASTGKTQLVKAIAQHMDAPFAFLQCLNKMDVDSFLGVLNPQINQQQNQVWRIDYTKVFDVLINGGILCLDEFNNLDPTTQLFFNDVLEGSNRSFMLFGKSYQVHKDLIVFATGNVGYAGTKKINEAVKSRFEQIDMPALTPAQLLKLFNKKEPMLPHVANGNSKKFVEFLFKVQQFTKTLVEENGSIIEAPNITPRQMQFFFDKLFSYNDFKLAFVDWITGLLNSSSLTSQEVKDFLNHFDTEVMTLNAAYKHAYIKETPVKLNDSDSEEDLSEILETITDTDLLNKMNSFKNKVKP
jgi:transcriptional regulator with PAS, ATPase and Fis domain